MKSESNGNDKFKEWREVKIIENEHICKNLVLRINFTKFVFSFTLDIFCTMLFYFYYWIWTGKYRLERPSKMENLRVFHI